MSNFQRFSALIIRSRNSGVISRALSGWNRIERRGRIIIAAHGNSLRALIKYLDAVSDEDIVGLNIPTGIPLVYELDAGLRPVRHYYLGDPAV